MKFLKTKASDSKTDNELVEYYRHSKKEVCIEIFFNRYCHLVFAVCMNYLHNEDQSKDAAIEIFEKMGSDLQKYQVRDFGSWLHTVTKNYCFHLLRKRNTVVELREEDLKNQNEIETSFPEGESEQTEQEILYLKSLDEALANLPNEQRICVELFYLREKSYEEIQTETGYNYKQVKSFIQNGKRNMKNHLSKKKNGN